MNPNKFNFQQCSPVSYLPLCWLSLSSQLRAFFPATTGALTIRSCCAADNLTLLTKSVVCLFQDLCHDEQLEISF